MFPALLLTLSAVVYRIVTGILIHSGATGLSNYAPLAAIALCGAVYFPPKFKLALPLLALFLSDAILNYYYARPLSDPHILSRYLALGLICWMGLLFQNSRSLKHLLPAALLASTVFYLITNTFSWLSDPGYLKTFGGWIQAMTVGLPQYSATPTWMFFRNSVAGDLVYTALFVGCMNLSPNPGRARAQAALPRVA